MTIRSLHRMGVLLVNKPSGPTSYDMIRWVKRSVKGVKIGHCGTLDPLASGLLIVLMGRATKRQSHYMKLIKQYRFELQLGCQTDTGDILGKVIKQEEPCNISDEKIAGVLMKFKGKQEQVPPMYSAIKQNGKSLYELARQGIEVKRDPREIDITEIELLNRVTPNLLDVRIRCSSGTYVRTLAEDIARKLGTVGTVKSLVRESIGEYELSAAIPGESLKSMTENDVWDACH